MNGAPQPDNTRSRFRRVDDLFQAVCDLPQAEREAKLRGLTDDPSDIAEVIALFAAEAEAETRGHLSVASAQSAVARTISDASAQPDQLAGFRVIRTLGEGGMGVVYEAEQDRPRRTVALKVMRPGLATPELVRRFEFEAEALGRLRHPAIAQIYEAGVAQTPAGPRPYFAMEFADGLPLHRWAEETNATTRERLEAIERICEAVQHAHGQGIIHRDLKPANILAYPGKGTGPGTGSGVGSGVESGVGSGTGVVPGTIKILDFGIARATDRADHATLHTSQGQIVGTLPYMSPEQLSGDPAAIDTRSDIYSLGVVLHQLLTGRLPFDTANASVVAAAKVVAEGNAPKLSTFDARFKGDIETIVAKAIDPDKDRRYQTAAAMADDIRRHLAGDTISARPASVSYQLSRLARRHAAAFTAAAVVLCVLVIAVVGIAFALTEAIEQRSIADERAAEAQRQTELAEERAIEAQRQAAIAEAVTSFLNNDVLAAVVPSAMGRDVTVREALDAAAESLDDRFLDEPSTAAAIRNNIGNVYYAVGALQQAEDMIAQAVPMFDEALGPDAKMTQFARQDLASIRSAMGRPAEALALLEDVLVSRDTTVGPSHPEALETVVMIAEGYANGTRDLEAAAESLADFDARLANATGDTDRVETYAAFVRGSLALEQRDYETAASAFERVARARETQYGADHPATITALQNAAVAYEALGRYAEAEPIYLRNLDYHRRLSGPDSPDTLVTAHNLAFLYQSMDRLEDAEPMFIDTLERCRKTFGPTHPGTLTCTQSLSSLYRSTGRIDEAIALLTTARAIALDAAGPVSPAVVDLSMMLAIATTEAWRSEEALALFAEIAPSVRTLYPEDHPSMRSLVRAWNAAIERLDDPTLAAKAIAELAAHEAAVGDTAGAE